MKNNSNALKGRASENGERALENGGSDKRAAQISVSSDEDEPLAKKAKTSKGGATKSGGARPVKEEDESSDSDAPLGRPTATKAVARKSKARNVSESSDSDTPLTMASSNGASKKQRNDKQEGQDDHEDGDNDVEEEEGEEEEDEEEDGDGEGESSAKTSGGPKIEHSGTGGEKWKTLYHTGPRFPPPYEPLPKAVQMRYDGKPVRLSPEAEEAAYFYAVKLETQHARDAVFNQNFFKDWKAILKEHKPVSGAQSVRNALLT